MEPISVIVILAIGFAVVFACGYAIVRTFFRDFDVVTQIAMSGVFGLAQVLVAYFLTKSFLMLGDAILATFLIDVILVSLPWMMKK